MLLKNYLRRKKTVLYNKQIQKQKPPFSIIMNRSVISERINGRSLIKQPLNFLEIGKGIHPFIKIIYTYMYILILFICFSSFVNGELLAAKQQEIQITKVSTIKDPYERAISWSIYIYKTSLSHPQTISQKLITGETLWADDFIWKEAMLLLTKAEIAKVKGEYKHTTTNVLKVIQLLEAKHQPSLEEKKILSIAYITFARFSKYTKEKEGINYAYKGLELATSINFTTGRVFAHNQIGLLIGYFRKDHEVALGHFMQAKELLADLPEEVYEFINGFILGNIAKTWSDLGNIEKSIAYKLSILEEGKLNLELLSSEHYLIR